MSATGPAPFADLAPHLVGRQREQTALQAALAAALAGWGSLVLIGGEAGIGKTALAEEACREAADSGALVLVGRCYDLGETPPYGPWREVFADAPTGDDLPCLPVAVLPEKHHGDVLTSREAIVERVRALSWLPCSSKVDFQQSPLESAKIPARMSRVARRARSSGRMEQGATTGGGKGGRSVGVDTHQRAQVPLAIDAAVRTCGSRTVANTR